MSSGQTYGGWARTAKGISGYRERVLNSVLKMESRFNYTWYCTSDATLFIVKVKIVYWKCIRGDEQSVI